MTSYGHFQRVIQRCPICDSAHHDEARHHEIEQIVAWRPTADGPHLVGGALRSYTAGIHSGDAVNGARLATGGLTGADLNDRAGQEKRDAKGDA